MAFLHLAAQTSLLRMQKNDMSLEYSIMLNQIQKLQKEEADYVKQFDDDDDFDVDNDPEYQRLFKEEQFITTQSESLKNQIDVIESEISSLQTLTKNDVKASTQLSLLGGS